MLLFVEILFVEVHPFNLCKLHSKHFALPFSLFQICQFLPQSEYQLIRLLLLRMLATLCNHYNAKRAGTITRVVVGGSKAYRGFCANHSSLE